MQIKQLEFLLNFYDIWVKKYIEKSLEKEF